MAGDNTSGNGGVDSDILIITLMTWSVHYHSHSDGGRGSLGLTKVNPLTANDTVPR